MQYVDFLGHRVSKLIIGDNQMNGYSYIANKVPGSEMLEYYTTEKIKETLFYAEELGYNTMLPLADPYMIRVLQEYRRDGGKLQLIFQTHMPMDQSVSIRQMATVEPIALYHNGARSDDLFDQGRTREILDMIGRYRELGVPVGLGTHMPDVIAKSEEEAWPVDFYMACMQHARRGHTGIKPFAPDTTGLDFVFYPEDRAVMLDRLKKVEKPVIAYKIFAGGQMFLGRTEEEKRQLITGVYNEVFGALKPNDIAAMGIFQRDKDEAKEDAELLDRWAKA